MPELRQIAMHRSGSRGESWAVKQIWDRLDGKPAQSITTEINEKHSALDWTTEELGLPNESTSRGGPA